MTDFEEFFSGDRRVLSKILTKIENGTRDQRKKIIKKLWERSDDLSSVIGITGPPGVGKSTILSKIVDNLKEDNEIAVIAVDPSSPKSGGALLGDRIRMETSSNVFIRSMATRGSMGGLSKTTSDVIRVMQSFGFDYIFVETVGAGQSEVDVMKYADTVVMTTMPDLGDDIQALKAGLLEIGDIFIVNKSDKEGADKKVFELESILRNNSLQSKEKKDEWNPPIIKTVAINGDGVIDLISTIKKHQNYIKDKKKIESKRVNKIREELLESTNEIVRNKLNERKEDFDSIVKKVVNHKEDPYTASERVINLLKEEL